MIENMTVESENDVKKSINDMLTKAGYTLYRINNAPIRGKIFHGRKGLSDILALKAGEHALFIEGKATGKKPSDKQEEFLRLINSSKKPVGIWADSFDMFFKQYKDKIRIW